MKILAQATAGSTLAGFQRAAEAAGHQWIWWEASHTPAFDVFDEVKPDVLFFMEGTRPLLKCLGEFKTPTVQGFEETPFTFSVEGEIFECKRLVDSHMFCQGDSNPAYECDIGIVCPPLPLGITLCDQLGSISIKIMCEETWPVAQYLGIGSLEDKRELYRSSRGVVVDSMLEAMRVMACGAIPISTTPMLLSIGQDELIYCAKDVNTIIALIAQAKKLEDEDGLKQLRQDFKECIDGHTYDDALGVIMGELA